MVVSAIAVGALAGLTDSASAIVKDAYASLRTLITSRYPQVDVSPVEEKPASSAKRASLAEDLTEVGAAEDSDLLDAALEVVAAIKASDAAAGPAVGVDLERVEAAALRIRSVTSEGTGVRIRGGQFTGEIDIGDVRVGRTGPDSPPQ